ncbi:MAG: dTDP-4-dehydrorhamnose reductase, partial [Patescibacteria group bacterium]
MIKVIVLGAGGNLGNRIYKSFNEEDGYKVLGWDKEDVDITDKELIIGKIKEVKPDIIINTAAYNDVDKCEDDEREFEKAKMINGRAVGFLAEAALEINALMIHFSTDYVFAGDKQEGYKETDEPAPINRYGRSKRMGEEELITESGGGLKWYLIRTSKLFGPVSGTGEAKRSFFDKILELSEEKKELSIVRGEEVSCFTYTPDLAEKVKEIVEIKNPYGIYHITNSGAADWYGGAEELFRLKQKNDIVLTPVSSADFDRPAKRPKYSILINTKLEPLRSWQEA